MSDSQPFNVITPAEYQRLTVEQKLEYLKSAFRQRQAAEPERTVSEEAARQSAAAESKI